MFLAAEDGHLKVVQLLLEKDANKEVADIDGVRPLNLAIEMVISMWSTYWEEDGPRNKAAEDYRQC